MDKKSNVYFIGIGGIGMSALARMLKHDGYIVSGSDRSKTKVTEGLERDGISVVYEQKPENITDDINTVVYTIALPDDHPELVEARNRKIPTYSYPEMLGDISGDKYTIAVSGTHGKTTTTAMIAHILDKAGLAPTVIVGSLLWGSKGEWGESASSGSLAQSPASPEAKRSWGSNFRAGDSEYFVIEACEYKRSFTYLKPDIVVITNIEEDHLDYYKDLSDIQSAFRELAGKVSAEGYVITDSRLKNIAPVLNNLSAKVIDYSDISSEDINLPIPGEHNVDNARASIAVGMALGISDSLSRRSLTDFKGTWRRFEYIGETRGGAFLYDDYAHHPTAISATLKTLKDKYPDRSIKVIFQPHLYSRTAQLLDHMAESLTQADALILLPVYAAREKVGEGADHYTLMDKILEKKPEMDARALGSLDEVSDNLLGWIKKDDVIITMGAGDVNTIHPNLLGSDSN